MRTRAHLAAVVALALGIALTAGAERSWAIAGIEEEEIVEEEAQEVLEKEQDDKLAKAPQDDPAEKAETSVLNGANEALSVKVTSWRDLPFQTVKRQAFDYSCGSAAVATLLTYAYGAPTSEDAVFKAMFDAGNKQKIRREGFSLLDMKNYLAGRGFKAAGYRLGFNAIEKYKVPFIALINRDGYSHFVVVKSIQGPAVLIGDPSRGNTVLARGEFKKIWNGISLIVTNHAREARKIFSDPKEWRYAHATGSPELGEHAGMDSVGMAFPNWQIAPTNFEVLSVLNLNGAVN